MKYGGGSINLLRNLGNKIIIIIILIIIILTIKEQQESLISQKAYPALHI